MYSLYQELAGYLKKGRYPFHMPGHKGNIAFLPPIPLQKLDVTELEETDNLHNAQGCIKETQAQIAKIYGADESFLLVNGSTSGIIAAICAVCNDGDKLAVDRNCHRAVHTGMAISGAHPVYFWAKAPLKTLECDVRAVVVTSPTYEGNVLDIKGIAEFVHGRGGVLIVDEAHGAHFPFHQAFPQGALSQGADIVIHSFHKTLPAFSQSAVLHVKGKRVDVGRLKRALAGVQTSSPSYMIMATTDYMLNFLQSNPQYFEDYVDNLLKLRKRLGGHVIPSDDVGKVVLNITNGKQLQEVGNLTFEMVTDQYTLAMTSVADTKEGFARLVNAMKEAETSVIQDGGANFIQDLPEVVLSPRDAASKNTRAANLKSSVGEVAGSFLVPVPPGIPILAPGERITRSIVDKATSDCDIEVLVL